MKIIKSNLTVLFTFFLLNGFCQQLSLKGVISVHNSQYNTGSIQYISNVQVSADSTSPTTSDKKGNFKLVFVGLKKGTSVNIKIEKTGLEVVNKRELQEVIIGRITPLKVYLAPKGALARAQAELYHVSIKALTTRHDALIARLRKEGAESQSAIAELEQRLNKAIVNRFEAEQLLSELLTATKKRLPELAKEFAIINLDFASDMYRKAYEFFRIGEIEKAIETLDEAILDKEAAEAIKNLNQFKEDISNLDSAMANESQSLDNYLKSILLEADAYFNKSQFGRTIETYDKALSVLHQSPDTKPLKRSQIYWNIAKVYEQMGTNAKALEYKQKHLDIKENLANQPVTDMIRFYRDISRLFLAENDLENGLIYQRKAYHAIKGNYSSNNPKSTKIEHRLIALLERYGEELKQQEKYNEAIRICQELHAFQPDNKELKRQIKRLKKRSTK